LGTTTTIISPLQTVKSERVILVVLTVGYMCCNYIMCMILRKIICNYCESQVIVRYEIVQITFQVNYFLDVVALLY